MQTRTLHAGWRNSYANDLPDVSSLPLTVKQTSIIRSIRCWLSYCLEPTTIGASEKNAQLALAPRLPSIMRAWAKWQKHGLAANKPPIILFNCLVRVVVSVVSIGQSNCVATTSYMLNDEVTGDGTLTPWVWVLGFASSSSKQLIIAVFHDVCIKWSVNWRAYRPHRGVPREWDMIGVHGHH